MVHVVIHCLTSLQSLELITDEQGSEWLLNPHNGYCYPVEKGIPIVLEEEGCKYRRKVE
ncbi:MAG: hypothetical protein GFH27_549283n43 [Chloroflexi bacterium AL-W]|nr:Trm112 family protein [Chloroflexi bacterium AL-N1]NOK64837.1 hypothetical protein [Chloroflexi bacterium AL-N10]NOK76607.1 hypothetical protein [Chloroflexi bacterium AL-N5]NOK80164.1 hypothetical protein [Chloroflexi bacterium AL-W]NOK86677.1 hypothetical protein [Chloroflexi bacterium AL-N15]